MRTKRRAINPISTVVLVRCFWPNTEVPTSCVEVLFIYYCSHQLARLIASHGAGADTEFKSLLAADTLDGWETIGPAKWRVTKGELVTGQDGDPKRWGMLQTKSKYRDFELKLDFKIDEYGKYNSGVYLRQPTERGVGRPYQVNIGRGVAGEPVGLHLDDWLAKGDEHDKIRRALKWNSLRIRIVESHIEVWLNGKQIVDFTHENPKPYLLKAGPIALQTYGAEGHSGWVKFRNMQLKDLSK